MAKKRWFRFHIDAWLNGSFGLTPNEIAAYITIICELYDCDGFAKLDADLWARRCGMRSSSFAKAMATLIARGKIAVEHGFVTSKAVSEEIKSREKLGEKSAKSREKLAKKNNEINEIRRKVPPYTEDRIQKDNLRGSALPRCSGPGGKGSQPDAQRSLVYAIDGGNAERKTSDASIAGFVDRKANRR